VIVRDVARAAALRRSGARVSLRGVRIDGASTVAPGASIAHHVEMLQTTVARYASVGRYTKCHYADIGPFDSIAWDSTIGATGHPLDRVTTHAFPYHRAVGIVDRDVAIDRPRTRLGPDVWIGTHVVVLPGVEVGAGAVIGAGSVVTADIAPYAIAYGSPARISRLRAPEALVERLLAVAWWSWPIETIRSATALLGGPLDEAAVTRLEALAASIPGGRGGA